MGALLAIAVALASACSDADPEAKTHLLNANATSVAAAARPFGWDHPVSEANTRLRVSERLGHAEDVIAGHTLREIVALESVRVRGDGKPCGTCHDWAPTTTRKQFCNEMVPAFDALPTSTGKGGDPASAKPEILKELLLDWKARGCPD